MRKWIWRIAVIVGLLLIFPICYFGYVGYRIYFHGPGALERAQVGAPTFTLHYGPSPKQFADLRVPSGPGPFPIAVIFHGGCWDVTFGNGRQMAPLADTLAKRGIATLNVEYRQVGEAGGGWPGTMRDTGVAIDNVRALAKRYSIDPARMLVIGHSAGAQLALWSAMRGQLKPSSAIFSADPLIPKAVVAIDGPGALAEFVGKDADVCGKPVIVPFMGGTPQDFPERYRDASPQDHLPLGVRQYLVQAALGDLMQPYVDRAKRSGDPVVVYKPDNGKHFDIINPAQEQGENSVALIERASREISKP